MLSAVAKAYLVVAALLAGFALFYVNPLGFGSSGGGDHLGGTLLLGGALVALAFAVVTSFRSITSTDVDRPTPADAPAPQLHPADPVGPAATRPAPWPAVAGVGLLFLGIAAAAGAKAAYVGVALVVVAVGGWVGQSWREHPLATRKVEDRVARRTYGPFAYPLAAVALGAVVAISVSRIYLTVTETGAVAVSLAVAAVLFLGALVLASSRAVGRALTAGLAALAVVSVAGAGIASAARGERVEEVHANGYTTASVRAQGIQYLKTDLTLNEGDVRFTFSNGDPKGTYHDVGIYSAKAGGTPFVALLPVDGGSRRTTTFNTKAVGLEVGKTYVFRCDFHPAMVGSVTVRPAVTGEASTAEGKG